MKDKNILKYASKVNGKKESGCYQRSTGAALTSVPMDRRCIKPFNPAKVEWTPTHQYWTIVCESDKRSAAIKL